MKRTHLLLLLSGWLIVQARAGGNPAPATVTFGSLLEEMSDVGRLARWPDPPYRTVQFSSYDRRSTTAEAPGWFSNADGFGREPVPGFRRVLREPRDGQPGLYLLADVRGPGAVVRGWSAGMGGVLRVYLDPASPSPEAQDGTLVWEGTGYDFLARRSARYLKSPALNLEPADAFVQQDADYLPLPFARGLRVTWEGQLADLHFYHLQIRQYAPGTTVRSFDADRDLREAEAQLRAAVSGLVEPTAGRAGEFTTFEGVAEPDRNWSWSSAERHAGAVRELKLRLEADALDEALRGSLLRISFDGSQRPHVEAPVGDFFASGPGINPFSSLPLGIERDGTLTCRFVMPFEQGVRIEIVSFTGKPVRVAGSIRLSPWTWDERSLYFRAKWRADHNLLAGAGAFDLPYLVVLGKGVFAGCAAMIMNPSGVPTAGGNWWGEGDEKILVDGEAAPSTFGTGSEDYFNYSWSRPDLFDHPYCGQPLDSGPDTAGYVSNHRFQILDAIPFERSVAVLFELWPHHRTPGLSYARVVYHYARPGALDDHRALGPADLTIPRLPPREPRAAGGASGARFHYFDPRAMQATAGLVETIPFPLASKLQVTEWRAEKGARLKFDWSTEKDGRVAIRLVAVHRPGGATIRALVDDLPLTTEGGGDTVRLTSAYAPRLLNVAFQPVDLKAGRRTVILECVESGAVGLDYVWEKNP